MWRLFKHHWTEPATSVFLLLEEMEDFGSCRDVSGDDNPGLKDLQLKDIFDKAGPGIKNAENVAAHMGIRSVRFAKTFLEKLDGMLNIKEKEI